MVLAPIYDWENMSEQDTLPNSQEERKQDPSPLVAEGEWAQDAEQEDENLVLVLEHTDERCDQVVVDETPPADDDITVAMYNREYDYPPGEPVTCGVYRKALVDEFGDEWIDEDVLQAYTNDVLPDSVQVYSFPRTRLKER